MVEVELPDYFLIELSHSPYSRGPRRSSPLCLLNLVNSVPNDPIGRFVTV